MPIRIPGKNKYHAHKFTVYGITFDSRREAAEYLKYRDMLNKGEIMKLELQPEFELLPTFKSFGKTQRGVKYTPDFLLTYPDGRKVAVEVKGYRTTDYILRAKMFRWKYKDIELLEVR